MARLVSLASMLLIASTSIVQSLDVEVVGVTCDESLPVTADLKLKDCVAGSRCTFGQEATVYGSCKFCALWRVCIESKAQSVNHMLIFPFVLAMFRLSLQLQYTTVA
jgi:hypothetical protein